MFRKNAFIRSGESTLAGDSLLFNRNLLVGEAFGNVSLSDTLNKVVINGNYGRSDDKKKKAFVTGRATMIKIFTADSLFLHADTLFANEDTVTGIRTWTAWRGVRFFKPDLQGKCDTLTYSTADSLVVLRGEPVMWNDSSQLTAQLITIQIANQEVSQLYLNHTAFIISREDSVRYNQVKGRNMTGYFTDNRLSSIKVEGNGQTIYYTRNNKKQLSGVNRADCSDMLITFSDNRVGGITLIDQPDATLYPIQELDYNELMLKDFVWKEGERPFSRDDIYR
jgi:lipopolysaccharide export system protein LptA